jgi:hypothetical protein
MRIVLLAAIAALAFTGVARANYINTIDLTGTIVSGSDTGPNGTNDDADLFGGGDLLNAAISVTISYDATYTAANGTYYNDGVGYSQTSFQTSEYGALNGTIADPFQISVTIGGTPFAVTGTFADDMSLCSASDSDCGSNFGGIAAEDPFANMIQVYFFNSDITPMTGYDVNTPSDVSAAFNDPNNTYLVVAENGPGGPAAYDMLNFATPEPSAWLLLFTGLAGVATLKLRRRACGQ